MSVLINRGNRSTPPAWSAEAARNRQQQRDLRRTYRRNHRHHGWACPICGHEQILEYPTDNLVYDAEDETWRHVPTRWMESGRILTRCANQTRDEAGVLVVHCDVLVELVISEAEGFPHEAAWRRWTVQRWAHEFQEDQWARRRDDLYTTPSEWTKAVGQPVPRFDVPPPPFARFNLEDAVWLVNALETRSTIMRRVTLHLNGGRTVNVDVTAPSYFLNGREYIDLKIRLVDIFDEDVRADVLALLPDPDEQARRNEDNGVIPCRSPYGAQPYCWQPLKSPRASALPPPPAQPAAAPVTDPEDDGLDEAWETIGEELDAITPEEHAAACEAAHARVAEALKVQGIEYTGGPDDPAIPLDDDEDDDDDTDPVHEEETAAASPDPTLLPSPPPPDAYDPHRYAETPPRQPPQPPPAGVAALTLESVASPEGAR